ncbi:hypothetical protein M0804_007014 [Polistes exclamans]|nr:hypothetical protein M0804_007014 [Polistes exclamans]
MKDDNPFESSTRVGQKRRRVSRPPVRNEVGLTPRASSHPAYCERIGVVRPMGCALPSVKYRHSLTHNSYRVLWRHSFMWYKAS